MTFASDSFKDFKLFHMVIKSTFLNDFIEEEVYVEQTPGFVDPTHLDFFQIENALYELGMKDVVVFLLKMILLKAKLIPSFLQYM